MSSRVFATGHIKDPVPLIKKSRALCHGSRVPPSFIHRIIIIPGLNISSTTMFSPPVLDADREELPLKLNQFKMTACCNDSDFAVSRFY